ncbi:hypothetical protein FHS55_000301 [Angulomicrobium tetraedrale]|uniref:Uncharacterized protein n=1 Tax=Ancylobacter tetraedralis TaxID=217068 RepID=A0A839Z6V1_9HYPH|nr:hypothetical protein [Ancylobacter tetraedralis]MBB3769715.1 hypothetical protein [Ancylobacter tetraedralis]
MAPCRAPGCGVEATRFGHYCTTHKSRLRRHGDIAQAAISRAALAPYVARVRTRIAKNAASPLWAQCEARWTAVMDHAGTIIARYEGGGTVIRDELRAAREAGRLADVAAREVVETVAALYLMRDAEPRRFRSDAAFTTQLVRRVRGLAEVNAGIWYDHASGRMQRVYRDLPPTVASILAHWLVETLGVVGVRLAALERKDRDAEEAKRSAFRDALEDLT